MIIEWRGNRAGFRLQRLGFKAENFVSAVKDALRFAALLQKVGGYPKGSNRIVAVAYFNALGQYESEHRVANFRSKQAVTDAVNKILNSEPAKQAKFAVKKTGKVVRHYSVPDGPATSVRTRTG